MQKHKTNVKEAYRKTMNSKTYSISPLSANDKKNSIQKINNRETQHATLFDEYYVNK